MLFTDNLFHNNGLDSEEPFVDNGLGDITNNPGDNGKFKTKFKCWCLGSIHA